MTVSGVIFWFVSSHV